MPCFGIESTVLTFWPEKEEGKFINNKDNKFL